MPVFKVGDKVRAKYSTDLKLKDYVDWFHALVKSREIGVVIHTRNELEMIAARFPSHDVATNGSELTHIRKDTYGTVQRRRQSKV